MWLLRVSGRFFVSVLHMKGREGYQRTDVQIEMRVTQDLLKIGMDDLIHFK